MKFLISLLFLFQFSQIQCQIGCRNQQGDPVDWFIGYKLPRQEGLEDEQRQKGFALLYMDGSTGGQWKRSDVGIDGDQQSVGYTLKQYYSNKDNGSVFRAMYNDEWPSGNVSFTKGHTKGALVFDSSSGFWLIHSVPKFPAAQAYEYPPTGAKYGQHFFCISFPYLMLKEVSNQLFYHDPYIYDWALPRNIARDNDFLVKLASGQTQKDAPFFRKTPLVSFAGVTLTSFSKSKKWAQELYTDLVAATFQKVLFAETWQNGQGNIGSNCTANFRVYNIANLTLTPDINFSVHEDHSKWVVSNETDNNQNGHWICLGDINRQKDQYNRGGGTVCMQNEAVWKTFRDSIKKYLECPVDTNRWI